jgi:hypothetical protein
MKRLMMLSVLLVACGGGEKAKVDTANTADSGKLGETGGMSTPESVRYDAELDVYFVANINGNPSKRDNNGFITVVRADSTGVSRMLVEGGKNGVALDAPKGMAIVGDTLWVADIFMLRGFNKKTGESVADIPLMMEKAMFLNDVAVGPDGIYVTDTGIKFDSAGAMTHPGENKIFKIKGRTVSVVAKGDSLANPNGLTWDMPNLQWILAPFGGTAVQTWKAGAAVPSSLATGPGQYDGVELLADGRILVSSWADSAVHVIANGTMTKMISNVAAPADIAVDTKRNVVAIPRFNDGKVEYYKIK